VAAGVLGAAGPGRDPDAQPILVLDDGANTIYESVGSSAAQPVSTTGSYTWAPDIQTSGQIGATPNIRSTGALPELVMLPAGYRTRTVTLGIGANTNYGGPSIYV